MVDQGEAIAETSIALAIVRMATEATPTTIPLSPLINTLTLLTSNTTLETQGGQAQTMNRGEF